MHVMGQRKLLSEWQQACHDLQDQVTQINRSVFQPDLIAKDNTASVKLIANFYDIVSKR